ASDDTALSKGPGASAVHWCSLSFPSGSDSFGLPALEASRRHPADDHRGCPFTDVVGKSARPSRRPVEMNGDEYRPRRDLPCLLVFHLVREADDLLLDFEDAGGHRDDIARVKLTLVFDVLLDAGHAYVLGAQTRRREPDRRKELPCCLVELGHIRR